MITDEIEACRAILKYVSEYNQKYNTNTPLNNICFRYDDVGVQWRVLDKLEQRGLIALKYKTNSGRNYVVPDIEKLRMFIEVAETRQQQPDKTQPQQPQEIPEPDFTNIVGHDEAKTLLSIAIKTLKAGGKPTHFLFVGPPASAKSMFLEAFVEVGGRYVSMISATKTGIRDILAENIPPFLCVDEIDKADRDDTEIFLEILQRGTVTVTVSGKTMTIPVPQMMVLATANNPDRLSLPLKSRFVSICTHELNRDDKIQLTNKTLQEFKITTDMTAEEIIDTLGDMWNARLLKYICNLATQEDIRKIIKLVKDVYFST